MEEHTNLLSQECFLSYSLTLFKVTINFILKINKCTNLLCDLRSFVVVLNMLPYKNISHMQV